MSTLPLHPAFVHLPLGLAFAVPLVAIGLTLWHLRGRVPRGAFAILLGLQALLVASGVVAMQLGERDEHRVEAIVAEQVIEAHEERAEVFLWAAGVVLAASAALLFVPRAPRARAVRGRGGRHNRRRGAGGPDRRGGRWRSSTPTAVRARSRRLPWASSSPGVVARASGMTNDGRALSGVRATDLRPRPGGARA